MGREEYWRYYYCCSNIVFVNNAIFRLVAAVTVYRFPFSPLHGDGDDDDDRAPPPPTLPPWEHVIRPKNPSPRARTSNNTHTRVTRTAHTHTLTHTRAPTYTPRRSFERQSRARRCRCRCRCRPPRNPVRARSSSESKRHFVVVCSFFDILSCYPFHERSETGTRECKLLSRTYVRPVRVFPAAAAVASGNGVCEIENEKSRRDVILRANDIPTPPAVYYDILWIIIAMAYVVWRVLRKKYLKVRSGLTVDRPTVSTNLVFWFRFVFDDSVRYSQRSRRIGIKRSIISRAV